jgi:hypothetical protein
MKAATVRTRTRTPSSTVTGSDKEQRCAGVAAAGAAPQYMQCFQQRRFRNGQGLKCWVLIAHTNAPNLQCEGSSGAFHSTGSSSCRGVAA